MKKSHDKMMNLRSSRWEKLELWGCIFAPYNQDFEEM